MQYFKKFVANLIEEELHPASGDNESDEEREEFFPDDDGDLFWVRWADSDVSPYRLIGPTSIPGPN